MVISLIVLIVLLRVCVAAALSAGLRLRDGSGVARLGNGQPPAKIDPLSERSWRAMPYLGAHLTAPEGPQDAPAGGPWDTARGPQDATGGPQDRALADPTRMRVNGSVQSLDTLMQGAPELFATRVREALGLDAASSGRLFTSSTGQRVVLGWASTLAVVKGCSAARALREVNPQMPLLRGRRDASGVPDGDLSQQGAVAEGSILDSLPRPVAGPAFFGGREDAAYLRGWDDGVDGVRQGHQATGPNWGSAAYMTGWRNAVRASEKALRGSESLLPARCP